MILNSPLKRRKTLGRSNILLVFLPFFKQQSTYPIYEDHVTGNRWTQT
jgi:hypothetical protein